MQDEIVQLRNAGTRNPDDVQRLEAERLRPAPRDPDPLDESFRRLLDLIAAEIARARAARLPGWRA